MTDKQFEEMLEDQKALRKLVNPNQLKKPSGS